MPKKWSVMNPNSQRNPVFRRLLRWVLELDQPVPEYSEQELAETVRRNYRWNFTATLLDGVLFWLSASFVSANTIVPLFISKLTTSPVPIGIAAMVTSAGWFLPQILTANWTERLPRRKPLAVRVDLVAERLAIWVLVLAALLAARLPTLALALFLTALAWRSLGGGAVGPAWQDLIARVIPVERRGRFWGLACSLGSGLGIAGSALSAWLLRAHAFPVSFVIIFVLGATFLTAGWCFLALTREPAQPVRVPRQSQREFLASLPGLLRQDTHFRRFVAARLLLALAAMGSGFVTVAAVRRWDVSDSTVGLYTMVYLVGQTAANLGFGLLADRYGHKLSLELAAAAYALSFAIAWLAPGPEWYYAVFLLLGIAMGAMFVSGILVLLEFSGPERRPTYAGIANTAVGVAGLAGPLLATFLASVAYELLFAVTALVGLAAWGAMHWWVQEPRKTRGQSAVQGKTAPR